jgi:hypothetical protein
MNRRSSVYAELSVGIPLALLLSSPLSVFAADNIVRGETEQGYRFMSGGAGIEERNEMMQQASQYDLALIFAAPSGDYLSDVGIVITDGRGKEVVNTTTAGPLFYAQLPSGRYGIKATYDGQTKEIKGVQINSGRRMSQLFHWNVPDERLTEVRQ